MTRQFGHECVHVGCVCVRVYVSVCVSVCERESGGVEGGRERKRMRVWCKVHLQESKSRQLKQACHSVTTQPPYTRVQSC